MLWQRSEPLNPPHDLPPIIPGSDTVRQAALQASWRRDRHVAQRRIVWRWVVWYFQRFSPHVLVGLTVFVGAAYLHGSLPSWQGNGDQPETPESTVVPDSPPAIDLPLTLRATLALRAHVTAPSPAPGPQTSPDTLSLKPENWLHSKEP